MKTFSKTIANCKTPLGEFPSLSNYDIVLHVLLLMVVSIAFLNGIIINQIQTLLNDPLSDCPSAHLLHMLSQYKREMHGSLGVQKTS